MRTIILLSPSPPLPRLSFFPSLCSLSSGRQFEDEEEDKDEDEDEKTRTRRRRKGEEEVEELEKEEGIVRAAIQVDSEIVALEPGGSNGRGEDSALLGQAGLSNGALPERNHLQAIVGRDANHTAGIIGLVDINS